MWLVAHSLAFIFSVTVVSVLMASIMWCFPIPSAVAVVVAATAMDCLQYGGDGITVGAFNIYTTDLACAALVAAALVVLIRNGSLPDRKLWPAIVLLLLVVVNLARGASAFGLKSAGNGVRSLMYLIVPLIAVVLVASAVQVQPQRLAKWLIAVGCVLTLVAVARWSGLLAIPESPELLEDFREVPRVLPAEYAILIGQATLAIVYLQVTRGVALWGIGLAGVLSTATLLLQHRSVWLATLVGLAWLAARTFRVFKRTWVQVGALSLVAAVVLMVFAGSKIASGVVSLVQSNLEETQQEDSTWNWRVEGFSEAAERAFAGRAVETMLGPPAGRDIESVTEASIHIHNRYLDTLAYYGVTGVTIFILWLIAVGRRIGGWIQLRIQPTGEAFGAVFLQALLLSQLTYFIPYSGGILQGILLALIWLAASNDSMQVLNPMPLYRNI